MRAPQLVKGATIHGTLAFLSETYGGACREAVLQHLAPAERTVAEAAATTSEVPYACLVALWQATDAELSACAPEWVEASGAYSIESVGVQLYGGILKKPTPREFLLQSVSLFRLFYAPGDMQVVDEGPLRAVLRLTGFDPVTTLFCRRQIGGLTRAIGLAGGDAPRVEHVRCVLGGDAFCEWELQWS